LSCGACCAHFRVSFYWAEAEPFLGGSVPADRTEQLSPTRLVMRGTQARTPRCSALAGVVGEAAQCSIYPLRPSPCRELQPAWEDGLPSPGCDRARAAHGLEPLTPSTWLDPQGPGHAPLPRSA